MRPTGKLHIGHYFGALQNWVRLQEDPEFQCFYFIADWHALTSDYADTSGVAGNSIEIATDYLASGLDPEKSVIFLQSRVPEHAELHLLLSMVTPLGWLERVPTYKEAFENVKEKDLHTYGFLGYPCLQTADIVIYSEDGVPLFVPVGEDQVSHVELSREIVRRFDGIFRPPITLEALPALIGPDVAITFPLGRAPELAAKWDGLDSGEKETAVLKMLREKIQQEGRENFLQHVPEQYRPMFDSKPVLSEPTVLLTKTPRIPGLDGRKMSKSYGNAITLSETDEEIRKKTKVMVTDPARKRRTDPGNPDVCPVYDWHKLFSSAETLAWAAEGCRSAGIGCIECKSKMADHLIAWIAPVRERRVQYEKHPGRVLEVIEEGSKRAQVVAQGTMERVREAVFGWSRKETEIRAVSTTVHDSHA